MKKIEFKNLPNIETPLSAENLNLLQDNIEKAIYQVLENNTNIDELKETGLYSIFNATGILPYGYSTIDNNIIIQTIKWNDEWIRQILYDIRSNNFYSRSLINGVWGLWTLINNDYATNEQVIGTILGKPLYRRIYTSFRLQEESENRYLIITSDQNIIPLQSYGKINIDGYEICIPTDDSGFGKFYSLNKNPNGEIYIKTTTNKTINNIIYVIEYTKTVD